MRRIRVAGAVALAWLAAGLAAAQAPTGEESQSAGVPLESTRIAVIDIERIAAESESGKALFDRLQVENSKIMEERARREQEIRDMQTKLNSEILSQDAKARLQRDVQRKQTEAQRWLEDAQREFEEKRQDGEVDFQEKLAPVVEAVARENNIGLILRATPGLTFVLDPALDISPLVVKKLDEMRPEVGEGQPPPN